MNGGVHVEVLEGLTKKESASKIAESFASISNKYLPLDVSLLPSFLPAPPPPPPSWKSELSTRD